MGRPRKTVDNLHEIYRTDVPKQQFRWRGASNDFVVRLYGGVTPYSRRGGQKCQRNGQRRISIAR